MCPPLVCPTTKSLLSFLFSTRQALAAAGCAPPRLFLHPAGIARPTAAIPYPWGSPSPAAEKNGQESPCFSAASPATLQDTPAPTPRRFALPGATYGPRLVLPAIDRRRYSVASALQCPTGVPDHLPLLTYTPAALWHAPTPAKYVGTAVAGNRSVSTNPPAPPNLRAGFSDAADPEASSSLPRGYQIGAQVAPAKVCQRFPFAFALRNHIFPCELPFVS